MMDKQTFSSPERTSEEHSPEQHTRLKAVKHIITTSFNCKINHSGSADLFLTTSYLVAGHNEPKSASLLR